MESQAYRLARGDPAAFAELYDVCADRVHHYLVARLGSRADADDVLQETFVRLARTREKLASVDNLVAYVFTIARNEAIRLTERWAREGGLRVVPLPEELFEESIGDDLGMVESVEWVAASMACLPPDQREVVELKIFASLTFREISDLTGLPQGTVATRYRSALEKLRIRIAEERE